MEVIKDDKFTYTENSFVLDPFYDVLHKAIVNNKRSKTNQDAKDLLNSYADGLGKIHIEVSERNKYLSELLKNYVQQRRSRIIINNHLKIIVFIGIVVIFYAFSRCIFTTINEFDFNNTKTNVNSLISLITVAVTYCGSLIGVLEIITKYLFPISEENDATSILKAIIENDNQAEQMINTYASGVRPTSNGVKAPK